MHTTGLGFVVEYSVMMIIIPLSGLLSTRSKCKPRDQPAIIGAFFFGYTPRNPIMDIGIQ